MARAEAAEEEVKKYKSGKAAQDGRIKDLNAENAALKKNARGEREAAENTATMNDLVVARQELANTQASSRTSLEIERILREQLREVSENYESAM